MTPAGEHRDFLRVCDRSGSELEELLHVAPELRSRQQRRVLSTDLDGRRAAFIWDGEGFRNRVAFELGVATMGGIGVEIPGKLGDREDLADLAAYLDSWFDIIVVRTPSYRRLSAFAEAARAPVINARTWHNHPCEILGDLAFALDAGKRLDGLDVVFVGEATNLLHSWCEAAAALPLHVTQVCPAGYEVDRDWLDQLVPSFAGGVTVSHDLDCVVDADIIYTDCWPHRSDPADHDRIRGEFEPLQITSSVLDLSPPDSLFLPCPPVTRGEEVDDEAMRSSRCRVVEAKDWLLGAQNALLADTLRRG